LTIIFSFINTTDTEWNVPRNDMGKHLQEIQSTSVEFYLWNYDLCNSYRDRNFTQLSSDSLKYITEMEHECFPTDYFKLLVTKYIKL